MDPQLKALLDQQASILANVDRIEKLLQTENRVATEEETASLNKAADELEALQGRIDQARASIEARAKVNAQKAKVIEASGGRQTAHTQNSNNNGSVVFAQPRRSLGNLRAFKDYHGMPPAETQAMRFGHWVMAALFKRQQSQQFCLQNFAPSVYNAVNENSDHQGGFLVPEEFIGTIIDKRAEYGVGRQEALLVPMGSDIVNQPVRTGGVTAYFVGEGGTATESTPTWGNVKLSAKKLMTLVKMSSEISEDSMADIGDWIANEIAYSFAAKEDACIFLGDGSSTYDGIQGLTTLLKTSTGRKGAVAAGSGRDTFAEINLEDVTKLMGTLPARARMGAKWYCSPTAWDVIFSRLGANAGGNTFQTMAEGMAPRFLGYPIVWTEAMTADTGTINGTPMILFGNLQKAVLLGDRRQVRIRVSDQRYLETDQIGIVGTERLDINCHDVGDATNAGAVVALNGTT